MKGLDMKQLKRGHVTTHGLVYGIGPFLASFESVPKLTKFCKEGGPSQHVGHPQSSGRGNLGCGNLLSKTESHSSIYLFFTRTGHSTGTTACVSIPGLGLKKNTTNAKHLRKLM